MLVGFRNFIARGNVIDLAVAEIRDRIKRDLEGR